MKSKEKIKVTLTASAIAEVLKGADEEATLKLRTAVLNEFAGRYLKQILHDEVFKQQLVIFQQEANRAFSEKVGDIKWLGGIHLKLRPQFEELLDRMIENGVQSLVKEKVDGAISKTMEQFDIESLVAAGVEQHVGLIINRELEKRWADFMAVATQHLKQGGEDGK